MFYGSTPNQFFINRTAEKTELLDDISLYGHWLEYVLRPSSTDSRRRASKGSHPTHLIHPVNNQCRQNSRDRQDLKAQPQRREVNRSLTTPSRGQISLLVSGVVDDCGIQGTPTGHWVVSRLSLFCGFDVVDERPSGKRKHLSDYKSYGL